MKHVFLLSCVLGLTLVGCGSAKESPLHAKLPSVEEAVADAERVAFMAHLGHANTLKEVYELNQETKPFTVGWTATTEKMGSLVIPQLENAQNLREVRRLKKYVPNGSPATSMYVQAERRFLTGQLNKR